MIKGSATKVLDLPEGTDLSRGANEWSDKIWELMDAVDFYIPQPKRREDQPFLMPIEDVFTITGRGTVVPPAAPSAAC